MDLALLPERIAEVGMDFGVIWVDANGHAIGGDCGGAMLRFFAETKKRTTSNRQGYSCPSKLRTGESDNG